MSNKQKSFVAGAAILGGMGLIVKVIGAIFRIPLTNIIGTDGIGIYGVAYPVYTTLLVISTAGLPAAISRMVSERVSVGDYKGAHKVFTIAFSVLLALGIASTTIMLLVADKYAASVSVPDAALSLKMIAPALLFVSVMSAYRGYFQGLQMMSPTAFSQLVEQVVKLGAGLYLASQFLTRGVEYGAAGALLGVSIAEAFALLFMIIVYQKNRKDIKERCHLSTGRSYQSARSIPADLVYIALPITLGGCVMPLIGLLDSIIIPTSLISIGYTQSAATSTFGVLTGPVNTLVNMPAVLSLALCMSLVPAISEARVQRNVALVGSRSAMGFKLAVLIGFPCAAGMFLLAEPIMRLLYSGLGADELRLAAELLKISAISILFLTMLQTMTGILQGSGHQFIPLINLAIGAAIKVILSLKLIRIPELNIKGAAIGTAVCYGIAAILNIIAMIRYAKPKVRPLSSLIMPILSTAVMGVAVYLLYALLSKFVGNTISTLLAIAGAVVVYAVMLLITGALAREDMQYIPGGSKLIRLMNKLGLWRQ